VRWVFELATLIFLYFLLKHLVYLNTLGRSVRIDNLIYLKILLFGLYVVSNALYIDLDIKLIIDIASRSKVLSAINLVFFFTGLRLGLVTDLLSVSLRSQLLLHRYINILITV
jgi:hypothetical protein